MYLVKALLGNMQVIIFQPFLKVSSSLILINTLIKTTEIYLQPLHILIILFTNILYSHVKKCAAYCFQKLIWYKASFISYKKALPKH